MNTLTLFLVASFGVANDDYLVCRSKAQDLLNLVGDGEIRAEIANLQGDQWGDGWYFYGQEGLCWTRKFDLRAVSFQRSRAKAERTGAYSVPNVESARVQIEDLLARMDLPLPVEEYFIQYCQDGLTNLYGSGDGFGEVAARYGHKPFGYPVLSSELSVELRIDPYDARVLRVSINWNSVPEEPVLNVTQDEAVALARSVAIREGHSLGPLIKTETGFATPTGGFDLRVTTLKKDMPWPLRLQHRFWFEDGSKRDWIVVIGIDTETGEFACGNRSPRPPYLD